MCPKIQIRERRRNSNHSLSLNHKMCYLDHCYAFKYGSLLQKSTNVNFVLSTVMFTVTPLPRSSAAEMYRNLNNIVNGDDLQSSQKELQTKTDSKRKATEQMHEAVNRVDDVIKELLEYAKIFADDSSSKHSKSACIRSIRTTIVPALAKVSSILNNAGKDMAPLPYVKYHCNRNENKMRKAVVDSTNKRKSADLQMLEAFKSSETISVQKAKEHATRPKKKSRTANECELPAPVNGIAYKMKEALDILMTYPDGRSTERSKAMDAMIEQKLVPCTKKTLYQNLKKTKEGSCEGNRDWALGRPRIVNEQVMDRVPTEMTKDIGRSFGRKDVMNLLIRERNKTIEEAGHTPLDQNSKIARTTLLSYVTEIAMSPNNIVKLCH